MARAVTFAVVALILAMWNPLTFVGLEVDLARTLVISAVLMAAAVSLRVWLVGTAAPDGTPLN